MTLFYTRLPDTNDLLVAIRIVFSSALIVCVVLGFLAIRRRDIPPHRAWMMRAYAIGLGAGTQALVFMVAEGIAGASDQTGKALLMGAAWLINLAVAEFAIRRGAACDNRRAVAAPPRRQRQDSDHHSPDPIDLAQPLFGVGYRKKEQRS